MHLWAALYPFIWLLECRGNGVDSAVRKTLFERSDILLFKIIYVEQYAGGGTSLFYGRYKGLC